MLPKSTRKMKNAQVGNLCQILQGNIIAQVVFYITGQLLAHRPGKNFTVLPVRYCLFKNWGSQTSREPLSLVRRQQDAGFGTGNTGDASDAAQNFIEVLQTVGTDLHQNIPLAVGSVQGED